MRSEFAREHGFLGNCDDGLTIAYAYTELVRKAEEGDKTAVYKIESIIRHSENVQVVEYLRNQLSRILGVEEPSTETPDGGSGTENPDGGSGTETPDGGSGTETPDGGDNGTETPGAGGGGSEDGSDDDIIYDGGDL